MLQNITPIHVDNPSLETSTSARPLTEMERQHILYEWNKTRVDYPEVCAHELFEAQAARTPDAIAIIFQNRQLTYREVNEKANQVAHYLRRLGVARETLVGICLERSPEMVIALLGVWKAGGAYVPFDPAYPQDRVSFMMDDANLKYLLTETKSKRLFTASTSTTVCLDSDWQLIARESVGNLLAEVNPSNLSYVMYTSGSTGRPKGAMIQHSGLVNYLCWAMETYSTDGGGAVPVHSSIAFDSTVASLYPPLMSGGTIELLPDESVAEGKLSKLRLMKNCSKVLVTPAHLELLNLQFNQDEMLAMTKILVIAGENLQAERLSCWRDSASETRLFNEYGPTETVVGCCAYEVQADDARNGSVPIGRPISNTQVYILNDNLQPVAPGVVGELYVGGAGVSRGYLNRPELTEQHFLPDPFSGRIGARLYKTGDLGRYRADGIIEFVGRLDHQVKLRGYRIELGEIESVLSGYDAVRSCCVVVREETPGDKQLIAYLTARETETLTAYGLRDFLKQTLPEYMVPACFIVLDSFPLNENGKVDRSALPNPSFKNILSAKNFIPPGNETEEKLAAIWMEVLKVDRIGIHDDFFESGGNSLLAMRAMSQIHETFGVALSFHTFFPTFTISGLAKALAEHDKFECAENRSAYVAPIQPRGEKPVFFCIESGKLGRSLSEHLGADQPFFSIGLEPSVVAQLKAPYRMEELARHLVSAILEKQPEGPYYIGGFCQDAVSSYEVAKQLMAQGRSMGLLALLEPKYPKQNPVDRFLTSSKRMIIRLGSHVDELAFVGIKGFPHYATRRWSDVKRWLRHFGWHVSRRVQFVNGEAGPEDLEKIVFLAASSYEAIPLRCPTAIFQCKDSPIISAGDPYSGWREFLTGDCETFEVPGNHTGIFSDSNVQVLARTLRTCLEKAQASKRLGRTIVDDLKDRKSSRSYTEPGIVQP